MQPPPPALDRSAPRRQAAFGACGAPPIRGTFGGGDHRKRPISTDLVHRLRLTSRLLVGRQRETETETERRGIHREAGRRGGERSGSESWRSASTARRIGWHIAQRSMKQLVAQAFFMGGLQEPGADVPVSLDPRSSGRQPSRVHATWKQPTPSEHARTRTLISRLPASPPPCESSLPLFLSSAQQAGAADGAMRRGRPAGRWAGERRLHRFRKD